MENKLMKIEVKYVHRGTLDDIAGRATERFGNFRE
jgi:hypothetical protein